MWTVCVAMIAGTTLDEMCDIMKCREWQANMSKMIATLEYLGIRHADKIIYTLGKLCRIAALLYHYGEDGKIQPLSCGI